ncbi:hypothetical protein [Sphingomonas morindae]|uniref:Fe-S oxidoreductase n=1 Tax=Sphingomonas morindae TaxID=1541170 RepID=A0ABY4X5V8_9SPHN|nr:hypothetical protein [Sphingomonas morindae]USI72293.1 hypothetical protein LHA26_13465 [Sphingomonas morindae]
MKKLILLASALALGGAAYAQDTTTPATPPTDAMTPATPDAGMAAPAPDASTPPATPDASTMPANGGGMAPGGQGMAPGSATGPNGPVSMTPTQGPTDLPTCSKTVTDNCKQGEGKGGMSHHSAKHRAHKK